MSNRFHFRYVVRDAFGTVLPNKSIELRVPNTLDQIKTVLYKDRTGSITLPQPLISNVQGIVEGYVENGKFADLLVVDDDLVTPNLILGTRPASHGGTWSWRIGSDGAPGIEADVAANTTKYYLLDRVQMGFITAQMYRSREVWSFDSRIARNDGPATLSQVTIKVGWYITDSSKAESDFPMASTSYAGGIVNKAGFIVVPTNGTVGTWANAETAGTRGNNSSDEIFTHTSLPKMTKGEPGYADIILSVQTPSTSAWAGLVEFKNLNISSSWLGL